MRYTFGGQVSDNVIQSPSGNSNVVKVLPNTTGGTAWSAQTGGSRYVDLLATGTDPAPVCTDTDGFVRPFQGPDGIQTLWVDFGGTRRLLKGREVGTNSDSALTTAAGLDAASASLANTPGSAIRGALDAIYTPGAAGRPTSALAPLYVDPIDNMALTGYGAANARTGLTSTADSQLGWPDEMTVAVTGTKGSYTLTSTEPTKVAGFGTQAFDCVLSNTADQVIQFNTVISSSGSTITLLRPLASAVTGILASRMDITSGGQHMTSVGFRGLAQIVAAESALFGSRGRIIAGTWDTHPPAYQQVWALNAAVVAYGESNTSDGGPTVRTNLTTQTSANITNFDGIAQRRTVVPGGVQVGTHLAGHGATGTIYTGRRDCVLEFWTASYRATTSTELARRITITVTGDGTVLKTETVDGFAHRVRVPVTGVDKVTIDVTNSDGAPSYLYLSQCTLREPGVGSAHPLQAKKIVTLGDSWFAWYSGAFATELARVTGATVVNHAMGGMTTDWGLSWFDTYVTAEKPDVCVINFYTNDLNNLQSQTFVAPDGSTQPKWPNGLTQAQCQARWRSQILLLVKRCQDLGIKPVVILPGGANFTTQWPATIEQPALLDWNAQATELTDATAYVNTVGKVKGSRVMVGTSVKYAAGPLPADTWGNVTDDASVVLQKKTLRRQDYNKTTGVVVGTDTNSDGLSDGFDFWDVGSMALDTIVASIVSGRQRVASTWGTSGGNRRLRMFFSATAGHEYLVLYDIVNATPSMSFGNSFSDVTGSAVLWNSANGSIAIDGTGAGQVYYRAVASTTASRYAALSPTRINSGTNTHDVSKAYVMDLTAFFADAPNAASMTTPTLVAFILALQP